MVPRAMKILMLTQCAFERWLLPATARFGWQAYTYLPDRRPDIGSVFVIWARVALHCTSDRTATNCWVCTGALPNAN